MLLEEPTIKYLRLLENSVEQIVSNVVLRTASAVVSLMDNFVLLEAVPVDNFLFIYYTKISFCGETKKRMSKRHQNETVVSSCSSSPSSGRQTQPPEGYIFPGFCPSCLLTRLATC